MLPYALHGYRTLIRISTRATPYSLVYNTKAILPTKVEIPLMSHILYTSQGLNMGLYQKRIKNAFNKKERPRIFKEGELVLKKILPNATNYRGKWMLNYEGPYVVKHAFSRGALILIDADGRDLKHLINADLVKLFYP
ncbi:hypothetical protein CR513_42654, partial [Mucuna pruriens]